MAVDWRTTRPAELTFDVAVMLLLALSFHFLTTLSLDGTRLRVGASDLLLPLAALCAIRDVRRTGLSAICLDLPRARWWLIALTVWMVLATAIGYSRTGEMQSWALVNKCIGWLLLIGYFLLGAWFASARAALPSFIGFFFVSGWLICSYEVGEYVLNWHNIFDNLKYLRVEGFFANPNAFGYAAAALLVLQAPLLKHRLLFPLWVHRLGLGVALLALCFSASRTALLGLILAWPVLVWIGSVDVRETIKIVAVTGVLIMGALYLPVQGTKSEEATESVASAIHKSDVVKDVKPETARSYLAFISRFYARSGGLIHRLETAKQALRLWREAPLVGIGLGGFYWDQLRSKVPQPIQLHNTWLWLLTETGIVGLVLFALFFLSSARVLRVSTPTETLPFRFAILGLLVFLRLPRLVWKRCNSVTCGSFWERDSPSTRLPETTLVVNPPKQSTRFVIS